MFLKCFLTHEIIFYHLWDMELKDELFTAVKWCVYANDKRLFNIKSFAAAASAALDWVGYSSWAMMKQLNMSIMSTIITAPTDACNSDLAPTATHGSVHGFSSPLHIRLSLHTHSIRPVASSFIQPFLQIVLPDVDEIDRADSMDGSFVQPRLISYSSVQAHTKWMINPIIKRCYYSASQLTLKRCDDG